MLPSHGRQEGADKAQRLRIVRHKWLRGVAAAAAVLLIAAGTIAYFMQRTELRALFEERNRLAEEGRSLRSENEQLRAAKRPGRQGNESPLEYVAAHAARPVNWDTLLDNFYLPTASAEENLTQLSKVVDPAIQVEITRMQAERKSAEQILKTLFSAYGSPKKK